MRYTLVNPVDLPESAEFRRWFGNSQVRCVMYHGTPKEFTRFDLDKLGPSSLRPLGFWFSDDPEEADAFADEYGNIMPVWLSVQRPKIFRHEELVDLQGYAFHRPEWAPAYRKQLIEEGYDGILIESGMKTEMRHGRPFTFREPMYIAVFSPTQIKSATGNKGTYDPNDPDIRHNPARENPGIPSQSELIDKIVSAIGPMKLKSEKTKTVLLVPYMEDFYFKADGSYPTNIEKGILAVEDRGVTPRFPLRVTVMKDDGPTKMDVLPVDVPPGNFPFLVNLEISNWPSPAALDGLDHELVHVVQWLGTGLIHVSHGADIVTAFTQEPGDVVFGAPKKKYRTYQHVPEVLPSSTKERLGLELSFDEEFMAYGRTFAREIAKTLNAKPTKIEIQRAVDAYFDDLLSSSLVRVPGSSTRWEGQKKLVRQLLEEQLG